MGMNDVERRTGARENPMQLPNARSVFLGLRVVGCCALRGHFALCRVELLHV